jgi:RNA polymerase sigma-70 factor (ECF subfamily)
MEKGFENLEKSAAPHISMYHILATISAYHCSASHYSATDWKSILILYNKLIQIDDSPIVFLNRAVALSKVNGPESAIAALESIETTPVIAANHLFYETKAELYLELNQYENASAMLAQAIELTQIPSEKMLLHEKLKQCREKIL